MVICNREDPVTDLVKMLSATGLMKFLLNKGGYNVDVGIVVVAESENEERQFMNAYRRFEDVQVVEKTNVKNLNFEVVIYHYKRGDNEKKVIEFLHKEEGLPIVLVNGIVPEFLRNSENIFLLKSKDIEGEVMKIKEDCQKFKKFVIKEVEFVQRRLEIIKRSGKYRGKEISNERRDFYEMVMAVAEIWKDYESVQWQEEIAGANLKRFEEFITESIRGAERMSENYSVYEAVRAEIFRYVKRERVKFSNFSNVLYLREGNEKDLILYDETGYYIFETLLRKMCTPLLDNVSFLQLKREMFDEGMIVTHCTKNLNFTINKVYIDHKTGKSIRTRFIKIPKEYLISEEGLFLEDLNIEDDWTETTNLQITKAIDEEW